MNKKVILGIFALVGIGLIGGSFYADAYRGDPSLKGPNYSEERHEKMVQAFNNNDYNAWKELMNGRGRVTQVVNQDNFARFAEMRKLMLDGKTEEANKIRQELGLGMGKNGNCGCGAGLGRGAANNQR